MKAQETFYSAYISSSVVLYIVKTTSKSTSYDIAYMAYAKNM